jgi:hypothetical protein
LHEGYQQGAHLGAVEDGGLGADQDGTASVVTDSQGARHDVDAVHAAGALFVVDHQLAVFHPHALGGAEIDHFFLDVESTPVTAGMGAAVGSESHRRRRPATASWSILMSSFQVPMKDMSAGRWRPRSSWGSRRT